VLRGRIPPGDGVEGIFFAWTTVSDKGRLGEFHTTSLQVSGGPVGGPDKFSRERDISKG